MVFCFDDHSVRLLKLKDRFTPLSQVRFVLMNRYRLTRLVLLKGLSGTWGPCFLGPAVVRELCRVVVEAGKSSEPPLSRAEEAQLDSLEIKKV